MNRQRRSVLVCRTLAAVAAGAMMLGLIGCGKQSGNNAAASKAGTASGLTATAVSTEKMDFTYTDRDLDSSWSAQGATTVVCSQTTAQVTGSGAAVSNGVLTISKAGTFILSGKLTGQIVVCAGEADKLQIVLNGLEVTGKNGPALYIKQADKVFISLADGSKNALTDSSDYSLGTGEESVDGAIFSKADLTLNGSGALTVNGQYQHGIVSKDDLVITGGIISVTAAADGLQGKDCVKIGGGTLTVKAEADGIKSNNTEDTSKGYVSLDGGSINITAGNDGVQAETVLNITKTTLKVVTGGGSANASTDANGNERPGWGNWGPGGMGGAETAQSDDTETEASAKGLKAGGLIQIQDGTFDIDASDDTIHSNGNVTVGGGTFTLSSGDDGLHADEAVTLSGGTLTISKSYEGIEGNTIDITGGTIRIKASDDGINSAGGNDGSSVNGRPGQNGFGESGGSSYLRISGGYIAVDASGDGIDVNGSLYIDGGTVLVSGSANDGNGAFDYDGVAQVTGGTILCAGSSGMAQGFSDNSAQASFSYGFSSSQAAGTTVSVTDGSGKVLVSFAPGKQYNHIVVSTPALKQKESYTIQTGGTIAGANSDGFSSSGTLSGGTEAESITLSGMVTSAGNSAGTMGGGPGGMGGRGGMR